MASRSANSGRPRRMVVAMVLGTALSSFGAAQASPKTVTDISRYCTTCWRNARLPADCWPDCTQDVFVRLLERVPAESWDKRSALDSEERREFVRAIDAVKKRVQRVAASYGLARRRRRRSANGRTSNPTPSGARRSTVPPMKL